MTKKVIGHVGVDSGQLLLCDPCYIESEWKKEDFDDLRKYQHKHTKRVLQYLKDFVNYQEPMEEFGDKNMNQLLATGEWEELPYGPPKHQFSYNACAKATLSEDGHGQLNYNLGHPGVGVAFRTAFGDGMYPVVATYDEDDILLKVEVLFSNREEFTNEDIIEAYNAGYEDSQCNHVNDSVNYLNQLIYIKSNEDDEES